MGKILFCAVLLISAFVLRTFMDKNTNIRILSNKISVLTEERPELWIKSCENAVYMTCMHGECATMGVEQIQEKVCVPPEDL